MFESHPHFKRTLKHSLSFLAILIVSVGIQLIGRSYQRSYTCDEPQGICYEPGVRSGFPFVYWQGSMISTYSGSIKGGMFLINVFLLSTAFSLGSLGVYKMLKSRHGK